MSDEAMRPPKDLTNLPTQENPHDTGLYAPEILFYPRENRIDFNILRKRMVQAHDRGFYHSGEEGPLYLFLSKSLLPHELSEYLAAHGMAGTSMAEAIEKTHAEIPEQLSYMLTVKSSDSSIAKYGLSYLKIKFDKAKGASFETDLKQEDADFVMRMLDESLSFVLGKAKSGQKNEELPPHIGHDPYHLNMTDEEVLQKAPMLYPPVDKEKIITQRNKTLGELKWLQLTLKEIQAKKPGQ